MWKPTLIFLLVCICSDVSGQSTLLLEKIGTPKKYTYQIGDFINVKTKTKHLRLKSFLWSIEDSSIMIGTHYTVRFDDIKSVRRDIYFLNLLSKITLVVGATYITLDIVNNLINNRQVLEPTSLVISGSLIGVGLVLIPISHRNIGIGLKWKLKVLKYL